MPSLFMLTLVPTSKVTLHLLTCQSCHDNLNPTLRHSDTPTLRPTMILLQQLWKSLISLILVWNAAITIFATGTVSPRPGASSGTRGEMDCGTSGVGIMYVSLLILINVSVVHQKLYKIASTKKLQDPYWTQNTKIIHPQYRIFLREILGNISPCKDTIRSPGPGLVWWPGAISQPQILRCHGHQPPPSSIQSHAIPSNHKSRYRAKRDR